MGGDGSVFDERYHYIAHLYGAVGDIAHLYGAVNAIPAHDVSSPVWYLMTLKERSAHLIFHSEPTTNHCFKKTASKQERTILQI